MLSPFLCPKAFVVTYAVYREGARWVLNLKILLISISKSFSKSKVKFTSDVS
jgi:hypothetical protein